MAENGGLNCGWLAADHKDYLRIRTKHNGKTGTVAFVTEISRALPTIKEEDINKHIDSYDLFLCLSDKKKELLKEYKELK